MHYFAVDLDKDHVIYTKELPRPPEIWCNADAYSYYQTLLPEPVYAILRPSVRQWIESNLEELPRLKTRLTPDIKRFTLGHSLVELKFANKADWMLWIMSWR